LRECGWCTIQGSMARVVVGSEAWHMIVSLATGRRQCLEDERFVFGSTREMVRRAACVEAVTWKYHEHFVPSEELWLKGKWGMKLGKFANSIRYNRVLIESSGWRSEDFGSKQIATAVRHMRGPSTHDAHDIPERRRRRWLEEHASRWKVRLAPLRPWWCS
jgi:hypothetical protein